MKSEENVFEKTYQHYLGQLGELPLASTAHHLGARIGENRIRIPLLGSEYEVSHQGIVDPSGTKPALDICVILSKYILMCPDPPPKEQGWVSFRDFKDSGPLITYFTNDVERAIGSYFSGRLTELKKASDALGGYPPALDARYDLAVQFDALPRVPMLVLYNDPDEGFPAHCSVLFEHRAEKYLDAECLAMLGRQLFRHLKKAC